MDEADDYETWLKITLTQYDKEVTKALIKEVASLPKKYCDVCKRPMTKTNVNVIFVIRNVIIVI